MQHSNKSRRKISHYPVIAVIFNREKKLLLTKRHEPKNTFAHNKWQLPGGGIEFGEHPRDALIRELKEEIGIVPHISITHPFVYSYYEKKRNTHVVLLVYPCIYTTGTIDISLDHESKEYKWVDEKEINYKTCLPLMKEMIQEATTFIEPFLTKKE